eukprot:m.25715 g.25715  ORF g.25715 m.25715 type:complete len:587 (+) comp4263_c0_seq1:88-1848(+)
MKPGSRRTSWDNGTYEDTEVLLAPHSPSSLPPSDPTTRPKETDALLATSSAHYDTPTPAPHESKGVSSPDPPGFIQSPHDVIAPLHCDWLPLIFRDKDWWSLWLGLLCLGTIVLAILVGEYVGPAPAPVRWTTEPLDAWQGSVRVEAFAVMSGGVLIMATVAYTIIYSAKPPTKRKEGPVMVYATHFAISLVFITLLATLAWWLSEQEDVHRYGLTFEVWGLVLGMVVSNTLPLCGGPPAWLVAAATGEDYIKVGLVLLGLDIQTIGGLLVPGLITSWVVTPIVIVVGFGLVAERFVGIDAGMADTKPELSRSLAMMIVIGLAVCGSSAATAVHGAIPDHAAPSKDDELKLTIALLNIFTMVQMIAFPYLAWWVGMDPAVAGGWFGGSLDGTGNVVAAGSIFDELVSADNATETLPGQSDLTAADVAVDVASTVKMIQNALIGPVAIGVTVYWLARTGVPGEQRQATSSMCSRFGHSILEVWRRFPKFVLGFIIASVVLTLVKEHAPNGKGDRVELFMIAVRSWWFTIGFVAVGLGTNLRNLIRKLKGGKSIALYVGGQVFDLLLTFAASYVAFTYLYHGDAGSEK